MAAHARGASPAMGGGGGAIPGGLLLGIPVGMFLARRRGIALSMAATCAAPAIPLAQAIGRWGNYFNQELYGRPTDLPWGLEIDADHLEAGYAVGTTFHPTFLYESLWTLGLCLVLLWIDRRWRPKNGQLMVMYVIGYGIGRFWVEGLRIDRADEIAGLRWNQWMALAAIVGGTVLLVYMRTRPGGSEPDEFPVRALATDEAGAVDDPAGHPPEDGTVESDPR
jgi:prolipoprotein diacylglyceryl transferase